MTSDRHPAGRRLALRLLPMFALLCGVCGGGEAPPPVTIDGRQFAFFARCKHAEYDLAFTAELAGKDADSIGILFGYQNPKNHYRATIGTDGVRLVRVVDGQVSLLAEEKGHYLSRSVARKGSGADASSALRPQAVLIRRRKRAVSVCVNDRPSVRALDAAWGKGIVALDSRWRVTERPRYQRAGEIVFEDDFMRPGEDQSLSPWTLRSGQWRFHSIKEKHERADATRSPNPFSFGGNGKAGSAALVTSGYPLWTDYRFSVSAKSSGGPIGLAFCWREPGDYYLLRWALRGVRRERRPIELLHVTPSGTTALARASAVGAIDQWYRLGARIQGQRVQLSVDGSVVFECSLSRTADGAVGLYVEGTAEGFFDDVAVAGNHAYPVHPPGKPRKAGDTTWRAADAFAHVIPEWEVRGSGEGQFALAGTGWNDCVISAHARIDKPGSAVGIDLGGLRLRWGGAESRWANRVLLSHTGTDGRARGMAQARLSLPSRLWQKIELDLTEPKAARLYVNGALELRLALTADVVGRPELYVSQPSPARFRDVVLADRRDLDWEQVTDNQVFVEDPFMTNWAAPQGAWIPSAKTPHTYWHKGDFYGACRLSLPIQQGARLALAADRETFDTGYVAEIDRTQVQQGQISVEKPLVRLRRLGKTVGETVVPGKPDPAALTVWRDGRYVGVKLGQRDLIAFRDPAPLRGTRAGISADEALDFSSLPLRRANVRDYLFERAPADWRACGTWEVTNRFACHPVWSHMNGRSRGAAILWSKLDYVGDVTFEFYVGLRMRQDKTMFFDEPGSYPRMGDLNATICADGRSLESGYNFVLAAWDKRWTETWTKMLREGKVVGQTDAVLVPRTRTYGQRPVAVPWMPRYNERPIHGAWYYVKIRKIGRRIEYYLDNRLAMAYDDPEPLQGTRVAMWTQSNSIVVARAKVSYRHRSVPQVGAPWAEERSAAEPTPAPTVSSPTHPGVLYDFESALNGWQSTHVHQGASLRLDDTTAGAGRRSLRLENLNAGGDFGAVFRIPQIDPSRVRMLAFDYRIPPDVKINVYLNAVGRRHFIRLTGPDGSTERVKRLGEIDLTADGRWHHAEFALDEALRKLYPARSFQPIRSITFGNLHEGYLRAGFGGNGEGAAYHLDNVQVLTSAPAPVELAWRPQARAVSYALDRKPATVPDTKPEKSAPVARYASLDDGAWFFHLRSSLDGKRWSSPRHYPVWVTRRRLNVAKISPAPGSRWGGGSIAVTLASRPAAHPPLKAVRVSLDGRQMPVTQCSVRYDPAGLRVEIVSSATPLQFNHGGRTEVALQIGDGSPSSPWRLESRWYYKYDTSLDRSGPSPVRVEGYLAHNDFENDLGEWTGGSDGGDAWVSRDDTTAASGRYSAKIYNPTVGGHVRAHILKRSFNAGKFPLMTLRYRSEPDVRADFVFTPAALGTYRTIGFTDRDSTYGMLAAVRGTARDNAWHAAEVNLRDALAKLDYHPRMFHISGLALGDWGSLTNGPTYTYRIDDFSIIPVLSARRGLSLNWAALDPSGIRGYSTMWSAKPAEDAPQKVATKASQGVFTDLPSGPTYLHIRACDEAGNWGPTSHWKFLIDNEPPRLTVDPPFTAKVSSPVLPMTLTDAGLAGVDPESLRIQVAGKWLPFAPLFTEYSVRRGAFRWEWSVASGLFSRSVADGTPIQFALQPVKDFAGNECARTVWTAKVDRASDRTPPPAPTVRCASHKALCFDTFTDSLDHWANWTGRYGARVTRYYDPRRNDFCVRAVNLTTNGRFGVYVRKAPFDARTYPFISFEYRMSPKVKVHFLLYISGRWYGIKLTAPSTYPNYKNIGAVEVTADDKWHRVSFNLFEILKAAKAPSYRVTYLTIADYQNHSNPAGATYYVDNFSIFGSGVAAPTFSVRSVDPTGIERYAFAIDRLAASVPDVKQAVSERTFRSPALEKPGWWYFHARAQDGAGNWSAPVHYAYWRSRIR